MATCVDFSNAIYSYEQMKLVEKGPQHLHNFVKNGGDTPFGVPEIPIRLEFGSEFLFVSEFEGWRRDTVHVCFKFSSAKSEGVTRGDVENWFLLFIYFLLLGGGGGLKTTSVIFQIYNLWKEIG